MKPRGDPRSRRRTAYAVRQADLLDALMHGDSYPTGFDHADAAIAGRALRRKRGRAVRRVWPGLAAALGEDFEVRVDAFFRVHPSSGDGLADGLALARWIGYADPAINDDVRVEIVLARARMTRLFVGARRLADPGRLIVVVRTPRKPPRVYCLPLGRSRRFPRPGPAGDVMAATARASEPTEDPLNRAPEAADEDRLTSRRLCD